MQIDFTRYYRAFGVRRPNQLTSPPQQTLNFLPKNSIVHYPYLEGGDLEINTHETYLEPYTLRVMMEYVKTLTCKEGSPTGKQLNLRDETSKWHQANPKFRFVMDAVKVTTNELQLVLFNYNYLSEAYIYPQTPNRPYNIWKNTTTTMFDTAAEIAKTSERNQFFFVDVPDLIPSPNMLLTYGAEDLAHEIEEGLVPAAEAFGGAARGIFNTPAKLMVREIWNFLDPELRKSTVFSSIRPEDYYKINLVYRLKSGKSVILNLAYLFSWVQGNENFTPEKPPTLFNVRQLQKIYLRFMISLQTLNVAPVEEEVSEQPSVSEDQREEAELQAEFQQEHDDDTSDDELPGEGNFLTGGVGVAKTKDVKIVDHTDAEIDEAFTKNDASKLDFSEIEEQLRDLEYLNKSNLVNKLSDNKVIKAVVPTGSKVVAGDETGESTTPTTSTPEQLQEKFLKPSDPKTEILKQIERNKEVGMYTPAQYRKALQDAEILGQMKDPYGTNQMATQVAEVTPEKVTLSEERVEINGSDGVFDRTQLQSTLRSFTPDYVRKTMKADVLAAVHSVQNAGVMIRRHEIEIQHSALGSYELHSVELKPLNGEASTVHFSLPVVDENGQFTVSGNKYVMRNQITDIPIRKISPTEVSLSSYYGKNLVHTGSKKANSLIEALKKRIAVAVLEPDGYIKNAATANVYDEKFESPYIYGLMSSSYKTIRTDDIILSFDHKDRLPMFGEEFIKAHEKDGAILVGLSKKKQAIRVLNDNTFQIQIDGKWIPVGDIFDVLKIDYSKIPLTFSEVNVFSKSVPVGVVLGYYMGFTNLITLLKAKHRIVEKTRGVELERYEYSVTFADKTYVFDQRDREASMVLAGFTQFQKQTKMFPVAEFEYKNVYLNLLEAKKMTAIYIRELDNIRDLFVDHITQGILKDMGEPETYEGLLIRASSMLLTYNAPKGHDTDYMRLRGYERFAGAVYKTLSNSIRGFRGRNIAGRSKIEMGPYDVWSLITKDSSVKLVEDINPIQNIKEVEAYTFVGEGGRNKDTMTKATREFLPSAKGFFGDATVDSSDVGVNGSMSSSPNITNVRGLPVKGKREDNPVNYVSVTSLLHPFTHNDDSKRANFSNIQASHVVAAKNYALPIVRTGYEEVIAKRTGSMFSSRADKPGKVIEVTEDKIVVQYDDKTVKGVHLGRYFGKAEGSVYPHDIVTNLKVGQKVDKDDVIAYNSGFFKPDRFNPKNIILASSLVARVAFIDSKDTHEDSCVISRRLADETITESVKIKSVTVDFTQSLQDIVRIRQAVTAKDHVFIIEDEVSANTGSFNEQALATLRRSARQAPRVGVKGYIDRIEVFYNGDKADMSETLRALVDRSDRAMSERCRTEGRPVINGRVTEEYRVEGVPLAPDRAEIRVYIVKQDRALAGHKLIFGSQLKSVISEEMTYEMTTEDGVPVDAKFSFRSVMNRVVLGAIKQGMLTTNVKLIGKRMAEIYFTGK